MVALSDTFISFSTMALPFCDLQPRILSSFHHRPSLVNTRCNKSLHFTTNTKLRFCLSAAASRNRSFNPKSATVNGFSVQNNSEESVVEFQDKFRKWVAFLRSILPGGGGSWWDFSDDVEVVIIAKPVTVWRALGRMWQLVAQDRWVIFAAFSALFVAALSEISIPHFLTASIFSAQSGEILVFHRNVRLLVLLCITSGICSGLRGCCFGIANMILVKRMRETLYSTLLFQDISFFDSETVGDLTSRLGADCQQVSRVIGNDLNMIMRNALQATGALIYLLVLSWPLGLCTLTICSILLAIMLFYGQYQKKAAKLTQEFTASANEVAQETFSLMRTVRVYGTEKQELRRYTEWLGKLADISLRSSSAYGLWNLSFNTLYHSTQVIAVLIGGMSILSGHITAERLTKFILYSEWLIFSAWIVGDNLSTLMQSVGASEKVFQLMDLLPSNQFVSKGKQFGTSAEEIMLYLEFCSNECCYIRNYASRCPNNFFGRPDISLLE